MRINVGRYHYRTMLGDVFIDQRLPRTMVRYMVSEMKRQGLHPSQVVAATFHGETGIIQFHVLDELGSE